MSEEQPQEATAERADESNPAHVTLDELREKAGRMSEVDVAEQVSRFRSAGILGKRMKPFIQVSGLARGSGTDKAASVLSPGVSSLLQQQQAMAQRREENRVATDDAMESLAEARRHAEQRADAQAEATIDIAQAQEQLQQMQARGIELATAQADAISEVAQSQQAMLSAIQEELGVLRDQAEGQRRLIHAAWTGGNVMEWTLFVAIIAAAASVAAATGDPGNIPAMAWVLAGGVIVALAVLLGLSQFIRRPRDDASA